MISVIYQLKLKVETWRVDNNKENVDIHVILINFHWCEK